MRNYQKQQTVTRLKKTYSALANTTNLAIADEGPISTWEVGAGNAESSKKFANTYLIPYLKVSKNCENKTADECKFSYIGLSGDSYSQTLPGTYTRFFLNDGVFIAVYTTNAGSKHAQITIDLNGQKAPNQLGKDVFLYVYYVYNADNNARTGTFMPWCSTCTIDGIRKGGDNGCSRGRNGINCAMLIMYNNWQITDDYPW